MCTNKRLLYYEDQNHFFYWIGWLECLILFSQASWFSRNRSLPRQARFLNNRAYDRAHMFALLQRLPVEGYVLIHPSCCLFLCTGFFCVPKGHIKSQPWLFRMETIRSSIQWPTRIRFVWAGLLCTWAMSFFLYRVLELGLGEKNRSTCRFGEFFGSYTRVFFLRGVAISAIRIPTNVASSSRIIIKRSATFNRQRNKKQQKATQKKKHLILFDLPQLVLIYVPPYCFNVHMVGCTRFV